MSARVLVQLAVDLPFPPSANKIWRNVGRSKPIRSAFYELWRGEAVRAIRKVAGNGQFPGAYAMSLQVGLRDNRCRDLDNMIKPIGDALQLAGAVVDDSHCMRLSAEWVAGLDCIRVLLLETRKIEPIKRPRAKRAPKPSEWDALTFREPG